MLVLCLSIHKESSCLKKAYCILFGYRNFWGYKNLKNS